MRWSVGRLHCFATLLDSFEYERLMARGALFLILAWDGARNTDAAAALSAAANALGARILAINCGPLQYPDPPRPDAPAGQHLRYRRALEKSLVRARGVDVLMDDRIEDVILFSKTYARTFEEQLLDLGRLMGENS